MKHLATVIFLGLMLISCDKTKVYEEFADLEDAFWHQDSVKTFNFEITDPSQPYHLIAHFRNSQAYPFHNLYYKFSLKNDQDSLMDMKQMQVFLFDPKTGEPNGGGIGDLFDNSQVVKDNFTFPKAGTYSVSLQQYMRIDTLPYVLSVGWRVEKVAE